jgi:hypothetical protein
VARGAALSPGVPVCGIPFPDREVGAGDHQPAVERGSNKGKILYQEKRVFNMDSTILIRVVCGVLAFVVLVILIQRRRTRVK